MKIVRRGDEHRIDETGRDQLAVGSKGGQIGEFRTARWVTIRDGSEPQAGDFFSTNVARMVLAHDPKTDDAETNLFHGRKIFSGNAWPKPAHGGRAQRP